MKVLVTTVAGTGHVYPMVPIARALVDRGHDVLWATPQHAIAQVEQAGLRAVGTSQQPIANPYDIIRRYPELEALPLIDRPDRMFGKIFGVVHAPPMLAGLLPFAQEWQPDLLVCDAAELAGPIVAAELGVPNVTKGFGPLLPERRLAAAADEVAPLWRSRGLEPRPYAGCFEHLYLDPYPPSLQRQSAPHVSRRQHVRPISYTGPTSPDTELPLPATRVDRPLVYMTMGTVFNSPELFSEVVAGLAQLDVRLLVTVGPEGDPGLLGEQPPHVRVERYVPQTALLPLCDVVVSHAGSGTAISAVEHGLPQLCLPQGADQFLNATNLSAVGAALSLLPGEVTADAVRSSVECVLQDATFRAAAGQVRASLESMPSPHDVVDVLQGVALAAAR